MDNSHWTLANMVRKFFFYMLSFLFLVGFLLNSCIAKESEKEPELDISALIARANESFGKGHFDNAISDYTRIIRLEPDFLSAYINRGLSFFFISEYDKAITDYTKAIHLNPNDIMLFYYLRTAYIEKGDFQKALWLPIQ